MTTTLTITHKGQVTLKKDVLAHLGAKPGDKVEVDLLPGGRAEVRRSEGLPISAIFGLFYDPDRKPMTIEEMNEVIADGWAGKIK